MAPPDAASLAESILSGDRRALARGITLVESTRSDHPAEADRLEQELIDLDLLAYCRPALGRFRRR